MKKEWMTLRVFLNDRISYLAAMLLMIVIFVVMMLLELNLYKGYVHPNTIIYYVLLALLCMIGWLVFDYVRQRDFYKELLAAVENMSELRDTLSLHTIVTSEQKLFFRLLQKMHTAYLNELGKYRRQQERHNHFVLQWVHHMKTPVSVIDLLTQEDKVDKRTVHPAELTGSIREENERLARGLEMMLYTARLDKFEIDLHIRRVALHEVARSAINSFKKMCIRHAIFPKIVGEAYGETDEKWMTFMLNQLLSNAIKYSKHKPGTKQLIVTLRKDKDKDSITVSDQGVGIADHDLRRIYDPFFTGDNGRTEGESTGMGLYLTKQVCDKLGHELIVQSVVGEGTSVTIVCQSGGIHKLTS
ncbi:sensor histidine kinase [Paenibacillus sp. IITD108]|uniref:sensor histidine kinase n=1 Tax=Paenibacillus sp. IITD108 TaxID=3116649 RepID=UPI002F40A92C